MYGPWSAYSLGHACINLGHASGRDLREPDVIVMLRWALGTIDPNHVCVQGHIRRVRDARRDLSLPPRAAAAAQVSGEGDSSLIRW